MKSVQEAEPIPNPEEKPVKPEGAQPTPLSQEEVEKLIIDNKGLAYWFANQWRTIPGVSQEDIDSQAIHGLVKAANTYHPSKGSFSGYASQVIRNYLGHLNFKQGEQAPVSTSLDAPLGGEEGDDGDLHSKISDEGSPSVDSDQSEGALLIQQEVEALPEPDRSMVRRWMNGESYRDMQADFKISFMQIRNRVSAAMGKIRANLAKKGVVSVSDIWPESLDEDGTDGKFIYECIVANVSACVAVKALQESGVREQLSKI